MTEQLTLSQISRLSDSRDLLDAVHGQLLLMVCGNGMLAYPGPQGVWALQLLQGKRRADVRAVTARLACRHDIQGHLMGPDGPNDQTIRTHIDWACEGVIPDFTNATDPGDGTELQ